MKYQVKVQMVCRTSATLEVAARSAEEAKEKAEELASLHPGDYDWGEEREWDHEFLPFAVCRLKCLDCGRKLTAESPLPEEFRFVDVERGVVCWPCNDRRKESVRRTEDSQKGQGRE